MKPRINKKLSKKLVELLPETYEYAWKNTRKEPRYRDEWLVDCMSGFMCIGGGFDSIGEVEEVSSVWDDFTENYLWVFKFPNHNNCGIEVWWPDKGGFKLTGKSAIQKIKKDGIK